MVTKIGAQVWRLGNALASAGVYCAGLCATPPLLGALFDGEKPWDESRAGEQTRSLVGEKLICVRGGGVRGDADDSVSAA